MEKDYFKLYWFKICFNEKVYEALKEWNQCVKMSTFVCSRKTEKYIETSGRFLPFR